MVTLDAVITEVGPCGPFQVLLASSCLAALGCSVWSMMFMAFGFYNPGWVCLDDVVLSDNQSVISTVAPDWSSSNISDALSRNESTSRVSHLDVDRCVEFNRCRNVSFLPGSSTVVSEWGLVCDHKWVPSIIFTIQTVGVFLGAYLSGYLGDRMGRRACLYGMVALHAIVNLLALFSPSWKIFATLRFFLGIAFGGMFTSNISFGLEFLDPFWRSVFASFPMWNISATAFSVAVLFLRDWRHLHALTAAISAVAFLPVFWVPESMRWLAVHGRDAEASGVARKIAAMNSRPEPRLELLTQVAETERQRASLENAGRYSYIDLFRESTLLKPTLIMGTLWVAMSFVYYGISFGVQALFGDFYINFLISSVTELPGKLFVVPASNFLGRRWGTAVYFLVACVACFTVVPITLLKDDEQTNGETTAEDLMKEKAVTGLVIVAKMAMVGCWGITALYCGELFPTVVRNQAFGYLGAASRIGALLGPVLFPQDPSALHTIMAAMGALTLVCVGLVLALPETKGVPLQDTLRPQNQAVVCSPEAKILACDNDSLNADPDLDCKGASDRSTMIALGCSKVVSMKNEIKYVDENRKDLNLHL